MAISVGEVRDIDKNSYLSFLAAAELGRLDPANITPHTGDEAVSALNHGKMPNRAGLIDAEDVSFRSAFAEIIAGIALPNAGVAALDLVQIVTEGDDDEFLYVLPGHKSEVRPADKQIQASADLLLSLSGGLIIPFGHTYPRPVTQDWSRAIPNDRHKTSPRPASYAHRQTTDFTNGCTVIQNRDGSFPVYELDYISRKNGIIRSIRQS